MIKGILSITGKPGLYRLLSRGRNSLIVEDIATGRRMPTYPHERVISLADITMYTDHGDEPLPAVLQALCDKAEGKQVDVKAIGGDAELREFFGTVLPDFDRERVYTTDIRKLLSWYNRLVAAGITDFADEAQEEAPEAE
ncbi:MAG: DUF5606 domain-containing protein [Muribaculaceae bacterium]|nr:DUF5606 domain-containing protein [Muribaculaceae bacterium]